MPVPSIGSLYSGHCLHTVLGGLEKENTDGLEKDLNETILLFTYLFRIMKLLKA